MTWLDWRNADTDLIAFVAGLVDLRRRFPQLRRRTWLSGETNGDGQPDVEWWHPAGRPMRVADWQSKKLAAFGMQLAPEMPTTGDHRPTLLCLINRDEIPVSFLLPPGGWLQICESGAHSPFAACRREKTTPVAARSVQILARE